MKIRFDEYSFIGGRLYNEDSLFCGEKDGRGVFVLGDGSGSDGNGSIASSVVTKTIGYSLEKAVPGSWSMKRAFEHAAKDLKAEQNKPGLADMRTTAVVVHIDGDTAYLAHCGDSRIYHLSGSDSPLITADHSISYQKYLSGEISFDDIHTDEDRNHLTQALGNPRTSPTLAKRKLSLSAGDGFLLCSDGFWSRLLEEEIYIDYIKSENSGRWLEFMLLRILPRLDRNADNLSAICITIE